MADPQSILQESPNQSFPPTGGKLARNRLCAKRHTLDRFTNRLTSSNLPGSHYVIDYLHKKYTQNLSPDTISQAGEVSISFLSFLQRNNTVLWQISRQDIAAFVEHDQDRGLAVGSVKTRLRALYTFLRFLVDQKVLPPEIILNKIQIKLPQPLPRAIPAEDIEALLSVIDRVRDRAMLLLLLRTGMRIGELLNLKDEDISMSERKILIYLGEKNYQGRVVYYSEDAKEALQQWIEERIPDEEYLFYGYGKAQLSYTAAWVAMKKHLFKAGLTGKGYSLHSLRHTFATDMLNAGLRLEVLQQLLGHRSIEITRRYARMSDNTRETEYFKAMTVIEQGGRHESYRVNTQLQTVFEEKKLIKTHD